MKTLPEFSRLSGFILLLFCCGCDLFSPDLPDCAANNSFSCAAEQPVPFDISVSGQKEAFFKFDYSNGGTMLAVFEITEGQKVLLETFDRYQKLLSYKVFNNSIESEYFIFNPPVSNETYYLKITDLGNNSCSLAVDWYDDDRYELNNTLQDAAPATKGDTLDAIINPVADKDFFRLTLTEPDSLTFNLTHIPANLRMELTLADGAGVPLATLRALCEGHALQLPYLLVPGTYFIAISEVNDDAASDVRYRLTIN